MMSKLAFGYELPRPPLSPSLPPLLPSHSSLPPPSLLPSLPPPLLPSLCRTIHKGSIEIERGGYGGEFFSHSRDNNHHGINDSNNDSARRLANSLETITAKSVLRHSSSGLDPGRSDFSLSGGREEGGYRASNTGRWPRDARWRTATTPASASALDRGDERRSVTSSLLGGIASRGSSRLGSRTSEGGRKTEADVDLSDIKATMRRIDGEIGGGKGPVVIKIEPTLLSARVYALNIIFYGDIFG